MKVLLFLLLPTLVFAQEEWPNKSWNTRYYFYQDHLKQDGGGIRRWRVMMRRVGNNFTSVDTVQVSPNASSSIVGYTEPVPMRNTDAIFVAMLAQRNTAIDSNCIYIRKADFDDLASLSVNDWKTVKVVNYSGQMYNLKGDLRGWQMLLTWEDVRSGRKEIRGILLDLQ